MKANSHQPAPEQAVQPSRSIPGLVIRPETPIDCRQTEEVVREAFYNRYAPGCSEHFVLRLLRQAPDFEPWHSLVAEYDGRVIGQVLLSPARVKGAEGQETRVLILGPVCVMPAVFLRGVGGELMRAAIHAAKEHRERAIFLMGDPRYYRRFGFRPASGFGVFLTGNDPEDEAAYFMALPLFEGALDGVSGTFHESPLFEAGGEALEAYDNSFPPREKLKLPGQLR